MTQEQWNALNSVIAYAEVKLISEYDEQHKKEMEEAVAKAVKFLVNAEIEKDSE